MRIVCVGAGNHLSYSSDIIEKEGKHEIVGVLDSNRSVGDDIHGYKIVGSPERFLEAKKSCHFDGVIITIGDNWERSRIFDLLMSQTKEITFVNAIHPTVSIGKNVKMGVGVIAMAGCIINSGSTIEDFTFFATGAQIEHDCSIKRFSSVSAGSVMGGYVTINEYSAITLGVTIMDRLEIGRNSVVGAGSLVTKSVPDNVLVYGSPAKFVRSRKAGERFLK